MEETNLPDKELKITVIKMLIKLERRMDAHSESFNKKMGNTRKNQAEVKELKNTIAKLKNTLVQFNSRLDEAEERIQGKAVELMLLEKQIGGKKKAKVMLGTSWITPSRLIFTL